MKIVILIFFSVFNDDDPEAARDIDTVIDSLYF
jgi:hypothetical protein